MYGPNATPIFDEVARNFRDSQGFDLFSIVLTDESHDVSEVDVPEFNNFETSFPNEWLLYHSPNSNAAERITPWGTLAHVNTALDYALLEKDVSELETGSIAAAMKLVLEPSIRQDQAIGEVMDVIFGERESVPQPGTIKRFDELETVDMEDIFKAAKEHLLDVENYWEDEITPEVLIEQAVRMYEEGPIKMLHTGSAHGDEEEQTSVVDISATIKEGVEAGLIEVIHEEQPARGEPDSLDLPYNQP